MITELQNFKLLTDPITLMYIFIQISLVISIMNQIRKKYFKLGIFIGILLIVFNYTFLSMFYVKI